MLTVVEDDGNAALDGSFLPTRTPMLPWLQDFGKHVIPLGLSSLFSVCNIRKHFVT